VKDKTLTKGPLIELRNLLNGELSKDLEVSIIQKLLIIWTGSGKRSLFTWMMVNCR